MDPLRCPYKEKDQLEFFFFYVAGIQSGWTINEEASSVDLSMSSCCTSKWC